MFGFNYGSLQLRLGMCQWMPNSAIFCGELAVRDQTPEVNPVDAAADSRWPSILFGGVLIAVILIAVILMVTGFIVRRFSEGKNAANLSAEHSENKDVKGNQDPSK
ncbi:MAG: hypothetical protein OXU68_01925 [Bacteroidota bacterium]|nr:hypothetical protein [Bacteroidota bacterium]